MSEIVEQKTIDALLLVQGREYPLLDVSPAKHAKIPFLLQEHSFEFLVVIGGYANPLIVGRQGFVIIPLLKPMYIDVRYFVEEKEQEEQPTQLDLEFADKFQS